MSEVGRPWLSVVVPVHRGGGAFERCLRALVAHRGGAELIVVADGGLEVDVAAARAHGVEARVLSPRRGPAAARNLGARAARADVLLFIDADVEIHPDTLELLKHYLRGHPEIDGLMGSYDDTPASPEVVSVFRNLLHHYVHQRSSEEATTFWGACGAIRREAFLAVGGFDERYDAPCIEDIELGGRLSRAGRRLALVKQLQVKHLKRWTLVDMVRTDLLRRAIPWTRLILESGRAPADLNLSWEGRLSVALAGGVMAGALAAPLHPGALVVSGACWAGVLWLGRDLYVFVGSKGGGRVGLAAAPLHLLHLWCAGLGAALGVAAHLVDAGRRSG